MTIFQFQELEQDYKDIVIGLNSQLRNLYYKEYKSYSPEKIKKLFNLKEFDIPFFVLSKNYYIVLDVKNKIWIEHQKEKDLAIAFTELKEWTDLKLTKFINRTKIYELFKVLTSFINDITNKYLIHLQNFN